MGGHANYLIIVDLNLVQEKMFEDAIVLRDIGPWDEHMTVTNDAEYVVQQLVGSGTLASGQRLFYYDSEGQLDEIVVENGRFAGFRPCAKETTETVTSTDTSQGRVTVKDIIGTYLIANTYDGLFSKGGDCACDLKDLAPCDHLELDCEPGYKLPCPKDCGEHDFHISATKGEQKPERTWTRDEERNSAE
jgi:hypothetical protein